jgi:hypothetical protein
VLLSGGISAFAQTTALRHQSGGGGPSPAYLIVPCRKVFSPDAA